MRRAFLAGAFTTFAASRLRAQPSRSTRIDFESPVPFQPMLTGRGGPVAWSVIDDPTAPATPDPVLETQTAPSKMQIVSP